MDGARRSITRRSSTVRTGRSVNWTPGCKELRDARGVGFLIGAVDVRETCGRFGLLSREVGERGRRMLLLRAQRIELRLLLGAPALVVGDTTYGKGIVQTVFTLGPELALRLTTARWYTPSGRSIQGAELDSVMGAFPRGAITAR